MVDTLDKSQFVTGTFFLREKGPHDPAGFGRRMFMVLGVIAVPDSCEWKTEHIVPVFSADNGESLRLFVHEQTNVEDRVPLGLRADQILTSCEIWRV